MIDQAHRLSCQLAPRLPQHQAHGVETQVRLANVAGDIFDHIFGDPDFVFADVGIHLL